MAGQLRIIAGRWARRRIQLASSVAAGQTRPTGDRVREALFSALGTEIVGARVLDLFAGSGALGLEGLSRGAQSAVFCEQDHQCTRQLIANLKKLGGEENAEIVDGEALGWLFNYGGAPFDVVFLDPPYDFDFPGDFWEKLSLKLVPGALVIVERQKKTEIACPTGFALVWERIYGNTRLLWLRKDAP